MRKAKEMQSRTFIISAISGLLFAAACGTEPAPIYEATPESLYLGSVYAASSEYNCKNCHGTSWDGTGPEAKALKENGVNVPSFVDATAPEVTPLDYFKAITVGTKNTKGLPSNHAYQSHTDRARWAMAHYLYSLAPAVAPKDRARREEAMNQSIQEARKAYAESRRWNMGYVPLDERPSSPKLEEMTGYNPVATQEAAPESEDEAPAPETTEEE